MHIPVTLSVAAWLLVSTAVVAAEPSAEPVQPVPAEAAQPAPAEAPASAEVPADAPAAAAEPAQLSPEDQKLVQGYKPVQRGEKTVYCRSEREADSRMKTTRCYSLNQLRNAAKGN